MENEIARSQRLKIMIKIPIFLGGLDTDSRSSYKLFSLPGRRMLRQSESYAKMAPMESPIIQTGPVNPAPSSEPRKS